MDIAPNLKAVSLLFLMLGAVIYLQDDMLPSGHLLSTVFVHEVYDSGQSGGEASLNTSQVGNASSPAIEKTNRLPAHRLSQSSCQFDSQRMDPECPRFVHINLGVGGLGDRFWQLLLQNMFALESQAWAIIDPQDLGYTGTHGNYSWAKDFFNFESFMLEKTQVEAKFNVTRRVSIPSNVTIYPDALKVAKGECHAIIEITMKICGGDCYRLQDPHLQRFRHVMQCAFLRNSPANLPAIIAFDKRWYTVAIHIRTGDITLHQEHQPLFRRMKEQVDVILRDHFIHYVFIAEAPEKGDQPAFGFLTDIFLEDVRTQVSYMNKMDVPTALIYMMNADMLVTTGSSFPYIAATISPKPVVILGRPKESEFYSGIVREDFVLMENSGEILQPSRTEIGALVAARYAEFHGKIFPHDYQQPNGPSLY